MFFNVSLSEEESSSHITAFTVEGKKRGRGEGGKKEGRGKGRERGRTSILKGGLLSIMYVPKLCITYYVPYYPVTILSNILDSWVDKS